MNLNLFKKCLYPYINIDSNIIHFTTKQLKLYFIIISMINSSKYRNTFQLNKKEIFRILKYNKSRQFTIDLQMISKIYFEKSSMFSYIDLIIDPKNILIEISETCRKKYNNIKTNFILFELNNIMRFEKSFSIIVYCLLKQYLKIGTRTLSLTDLKIFANVNDNYKNNDFINNKIAKAIEEINSFSDIYVTYNIIKDKSIIIFSIENNDIRIEIDKQIKTISENCFRLNQVVLSLDSIENNLNMFGYREVNFAILYNTLKDDNDLNKLFMK